MRGERRLRLQGATCGDDELSIGVFLVWFWYRRSVFSIGVFIYLFIYFFVDKHLSPLCWFVLLLLCRLYRLYWGLVFSAFSARTWPWFWFLILCVFFCFENLWVGLLYWARRGLGSVTIFFFFKDFSSIFFLKILVQFFFF